MKLVIGIGNYGEKYINTRHNVGFDVVDYFAKKNNLSFRKTNVEALIAKGIIFQEEVSLIKSLTYVNQTGKVILCCMDRYNVERSGLFVICDDVNLPIGMMRIRRNGSSGGHKGLASIISVLDSGEFSRLRIGIGNTTGDLRNYVLGKFTGSERAIINKVIPRACDAIKTWIKEGIDECMNKFNIRS